MARNKGGRPKGSRDRSPRMRRQEVMNARRADFDRFWNEGRMKKVYQRIYEAFEDEKVSVRDLAMLWKTLMEHAHGRPGEAREASPAQTLVIAMPRADGGWEQLEPGRRFTELTAVKDALTIEGVTSGESDAPADTEAG